MAFKCDDTGEIRTVKCLYSTLLRHGCDCDIDESNEVTQYKQRLIEAFENDKARFVRFSWKISDIKEIINKTL